MDDNLNELEGIRRRIAEIVAENWKTTGKVYLLSELGTTLRREFPTPIKNLKSIVATWPIAQLVTHPTIAEKIGLVPLGVRIPENVSELFGPKRAPAPRHPMYFRTFWQAFTTPLTDQRFVILRHGGPPLIVDSAEPPKDTPTYEILASDIVSLPSDFPLSEKTRATFEKIKRWLDRNRLEEHFFIRQADIGERGMVSTRGGASLLADSLTKLSASDQARISIPLDVVLKILGNK